MLIAVILQIAAVLVLALLTVIFFGVTQAMSLLLGGMAAVLPSALFALRLWLNKGRNPESYPAVFFVGELAKLGMTVLLLVAVVRLYGSLDWLSMLIGLIVALKMPLFALWLHKDELPSDEGPGHAGKASQGQVLL